MTSTGKPARPAGRGGTEASGGPTPEGAARPAPPKPFARKAGGGGPEGLAWEGRTDEAAFRSALARLGCRFEASGDGLFAVLEARAGTTLMGRWRGGRAETRHAFPTPAEVAPGRAEVEVQGPPGDDGRTPFLVRWHNASTGHAEALGLTTDLERFLAGVAPALRGLAVTALDGRREARSVGPAAVAGRAP